MQHRAGGSRRATERIDVPVFVLDRSGQPLMPCSEKRARLLLARHRARVHRLLPFAIRLIDRRAADCAFQPLQLKLDPGSKTTGVALVRTVEHIDGATGEVRIEAAVLNLFDLVHRGRQISAALIQRAAFRRRRRGANLRYRAPRFNNRPKPAGWLAPSLQHRVDTTAGLVSRLRRLAPIASIAEELVRFDMQALESPDIAGASYQQGTLAGYEVREYLLEKWGRACAYCGDKDTPLNIDHVQSRARGGSNRVSNLAIACIPCNQTKGTQDIREFLAHDPKRLEHVLAQLKRSLKDAAAVNATRWALFTALKTTGLPVTTGSGGLTKFNRHVLGIPKTHALDAACVGQVDALSDWRKPTLVIKCAGRGSYQRTRLDAYGFPRGYLMRSKSIKGFRTGDSVCADVPAGKKAGRHIGRVAVRRTGSFNIQTGSAVVQGISHRHCRLIQRADGYGYTWSAVQFNTGKDQLPGFLPRPDRTASPRGSLREPNDPGRGIHRSS